MDLDQDGEWEVYSPEYFGSKGSFSWVKKNDSGAWERYYIDSSVGKSIQLSFVKDMAGEGKLWAIGANHTNTTDDRSAPESAVYLYELPSFRAAGFDPSKEWNKTKISEGIVSKRSPRFGQQGAPGVFAVGDVDGDGDKDVIVSGDGDPRIFWLRQDGPKSFSTHVLETNMPQGGVEVSDLDGDGDMEVIASSYEKKKLYIFDFNR